MSISWKATEGAGLQPEILQIAEKALVALGVLEGLKQRQKARRQPEQRILNLDLYDGSRDEAAHVERNRWNQAAEAGVEQPEIPAGEAVRMKDPEILEIFIDEATEELENIKTYLPRWCSDRETVRRWQPPSILPYA